MAEEKHQIYDENEYYAKGQTNNPWFLLFFIFIVPTLQRGNAYGDAPASSLGYCHLSISINPASPA
jgi:hypothetical protein